MTSPSGKYHTIDYLISGFRISIGPDSTTPGPRTHIRGLCNAWTADGNRVRPFLVSSVPALRRFATIRESAYGSSSNTKVWVADFARMAASIWAGLALWASRIARPAPTIIIERAGVLQSLVSFHPKKRRAARVIEVNGIASRETAIDRDVLKSVKLATALERRVFQKADLIVTVSQNLKDELVGFADLNPEHILVVPNGVSERVADIPTTVTSECVVGFVGALAAWSHVDRMLEVFAQSLPQMETAAGVKVRLEIIGDGAEYEHLLEVREALDVRDSVTFWGAKAHEEALQIMRSWNIGFAGHEKSSSATMYHSPLKVYEYAALGLITVCTYSADAESLRLDGVPTYYFSTPTEMGDCFTAAAGDFRVSNPTERAQRRARVRDRHGWGARARVIVDAAAYTPRLRRR